MNKKVIIGDTRRLLGCIILLIWAGVTVYTFGFHHHHPHEQDCQNSSCPFSKIVLNLPLLMIVAILPLIQSPNYEVFSLTTIPATAHCISPSSPRAPPFLFSK